MIPADALPCQPLVPDSCCVHRRMQQPLRDTEGRQRCAHLCMARAIRYGGRVSIIWKGVASNLDIFLPRKAHPALQVELMLANSQTRSLCRSLHRRGCRQHRQAMRTAWRMAWTARSQPPGAVQLPPKLTQVVPQVRDIFDKTAYSLSWYLSCLNAYRVGQQDK
jgi:hypothetical protein